MNREQAIKYILDKHGTETLYVFPTGYISRTAYRLCHKNYTAFYMQGSMGMAPAIGLGIAMCRKDIDVVVVNGDGALLMSMGTTHTISEYHPQNLFYYVLDNGCYESVGGQKCSKLLDSYPGVTEIIKTIYDDDKDDRVGIEPLSNTKKIIEFLKGQEHE